MGKNSGTTRTGGSSNPKGTGGSQGAASVSRYDTYFGSLREDNDSSFDFLGGRVVMEERESRDWSQTGEPWVIEGGHTLHADFSNGVHLRFTYTDGPNDYQGIYTSRKQAINALKEAVLSRVNTIETRIKQVVEKRANNTETEDEGQISRDNGFTYNYSNGVVDILRNGRRVAKGIRGRDGKYKVKWF